MASRNRRTVFPRCDCDRVGRRATLHAITTAGYRAGRIGVETGVAGIGAGAVEGADIAAGVPVDEPPAAGAGTGSDPAGVTEEGWSTQPAPGSNGRLPKVGSPPVL